MVEISNPGGFPYGVNLGNILTVNSSPRSRLMAEVIEKTGLIERSGQGVDIMFTNCIKEGKPLPDYSYSDDYQVDLRFYGEIPLMGASRPQTPRCFLVLDYLFSSTGNCSSMLNLRTDVYRKTRQGQRSLA